MRRAFTVVELLVVIAIIGVLVAITLPAVQMAREAGRKTQCSSQLKQIAMAALAHNTSFDHFPNAGGPDGSARSVTSSGTPRRAIEQDWGVFYQILPYLEQKTAYEATSSAEAARLKLKIYFCPTRRPPTTVSGSTANGLAATDLRGGVDYAGSSGMPGYSNSVVGGSTGVIIPRPGLTPPATPPNRIITSAEIRDGLSNVLMFGERQYNRKPPSFQADEDNGFINGWSPDTIRWSSTAFPEPDKTASPSSFSTQFGGAHTGVVNMALADGSVRPYRYGTMDLATFRQLADRDDNVRLTKPSPQF